MIYTSYYANLKNIPMNIVPVAISAYTPEWYLGTTYAELSPTTKLLNDYKSRKITKEYYTEIFKNYLNNLDRDKVINDLRCIGHDVVLLCYEKPGDFCHRHLVAEWLGAKEYGVDKQEELW